MARQRPMSTKTGLPTAAIYVFVNMLRKLRDDFSPEYLAAVFDVAGPDIPRRAGRGGHDHPQVRHQDADLHRGRIQGIQGQPQGDAGRFGAAGAVHPAGARGVPHSDDWRDALRGRRRDRHSGAQGRRGVASGLHRLERQGHDAAGERQRAHPESAEGQPDLRSRRRSKKFWECRRSAWST